MVVGSIYVVSIFTILLGINILFIKYNHHYFNEDKWTVLSELKWIFANLLVIGFFNALFALSAEFSLISKSQILWFEILTFSIGYIPMALMVFINEKLWRNKFHKKAEKLNAKINSFSKILKKEKSKKENNSVIEISYDSHITPLRLNDLIYIHSDKSGFELFTAESNTHVDSDLLLYRSKILRNEDIMQCHPCFIVNINKVIHVTGNARGYKLHLKNTKTQVPVSMKYKKAFERMLV